MKLHELLSRLAAFDPECEVVALRVETDWQFNGEYSIPVEKAEWASNFAVSQDSSGVVKIGDPGEYLE